MSRPYLPADFATQRSIGDCGEASISATVPIDAGRGLAISLATAGPDPVHTTLNVPGLLAKRFYRISGTRHRFVRTDEHGTATIALTVTDGTILVLWPVI